MSFLLLSLRVQKMQRVYAMRYVEIEVNEPLNPYRQTHSVLLIHEADHSPGR